MGLLLYWGGWFYICDIVVLQGWCFEGGASGTLSPTVDFFVFW
jgi:hypothetical protein